MQEYFGIVISFLIAGGIGVAFLLLSSLLGPKNPSAIKSEPFECGKDPIELATGKLSVKFYLVGMLFILFDVELIFLFPWAVVFKQLGMYAFYEMLVFMAIVVMGFVYAWKKGALEWD